MSIREDKLISECSELRADNASLVKQVAELRAEMSRKERVLNTTLQFHAKLKKSAASAAPSDIKAKLAAAKALAISEGRTVSV